MLCNSKGIIFGIYEILLYHQLSLFILEYENQIKIGEKNGDDYMLCGRFS